MFNIEFESIKYKNIFSVGGEFIDVPLNQHNKTLITGKNGAGKSTLIEALCFALYGKPFRNINKDGLVNSVNKKQLVVELRLKKDNDTIVIQRGIKPNLFKIYKNEELIPECASVTEYQKLLETEILGISLQAFKQIIVLGKAGYIPFMELPAGKRRELVEELLDIAIIGDMNKINKIEMADFLKQRDVLKVESDAKLTLLTSKQEELKRKIDENDSRVTEETDNCKRFVGRVNQLKEELSKCELELEHHQNEKAKLASSYFDDKKQEIKNTLELVSKSINEQIDRLVQQKPERSTLELNLVDIQTDYENNLNQLNNKQPPKVISTDLLSKEQSILSELQSNYETKRLNRPIFSVVSVDEQLTSIDAQCRDIVWKMAEFNIIAGREHIEYLKSGGICSECGRPIDDSHIDGGIETLENELQQKIDQSSILSQQHKELTKQRNVIKEQYEVRLKESRENERLFDESLNDMMRIINEKKIQIQELQSQIESSKRDYEMFIVKLEAEKSRIESTYNENCKQLERDYVRSCEKHDADVKQLRDELQNEKQKTSMLLISVDNEQLTLQNNIDGLILNTQTKIESLTKNINENATEAKRIKSIVDDLKSRTFETEQAAVRSMSEDYNECNAKIWKINDDLECCETVAELLKDTGVKSYIIKQYLPVFNKTINDYLQSMGADYVFVLDEQFNEQILSRGRESQKYENFSQGEASRINFALLMTWREVASIISGVNINLLILDEIFDGATDGDGVAVINHTLSEMKANVVVISHRVENTDETFDRHLKFSKVGRFTKLL